MTYEIFIGLNVKIDLAYNDYRAALKSILFYYQRKIGKIYLRSRIVGCDRKVFCRIGGECNNNIQLRKRQLENHIECRNKLNEKMTGSIKL